MALFSKSLTHPEIDFVVQINAPGRLFGTKIQINAPPPGAFIWGGVYSENSGRLRGLYMVDLFSLLKPAVGLYIRDFVYLTYSGQAKAGIF